MNDFRALLAFGFGLARHRALHVFRQVHALDLDERHLDAPRVGVLIEDVLQTLVQLFSLTQKIVEADLTEHGPQRGLRKLRCRVQIIFYFDYCPSWVHHAKINDRVYFDAYIVGCDDVLSRHVHRDRPETDSDDPVDREEHPDQTRPFGLGQETPYPKNHAAFILAKDIE